MSDYDPTGATQAQCDRAEQYVRRIMAGDENALFELVAYEKDDLIALVRALLEALTGAADADGV